MARGSKINKAEDKVEKTADKVHSATDSTKQAAIDKLEALDQLQEQQLRQALKDKAANAQGAVEKKAGQAKAAAGEQAENARIVAEEQYGEVKAAAGQRLDGAKQAVGQGVDQAKDAAAQLQARTGQQVQKAKDTASNVQARAGQQVQNAKDAASQLEVRAEQQVQRARTWLDTFIGDPYSLRRTYIAYCAAFWTSSFVRMACLSPALPIFGKHLSETLAPIERDDVSWVFIAITKAIDLAMAVWVYSSEGSKFDAPLLGILLTLIGRPTLYQFFHHHFLLSTKTVSEVLLTDAAAGAAAMGVLSLLLPAPPTFRPQPLAWFKRHINAPSFQSIALALGLGSLSSALIEFISDRTFLHQIMRAGLLEHTVPSYFASSRPASTFAMAHPLLAIPTLRSDFQPLNMPDAITRSLPFTISFLVLSLFVIPQLSSKKLSTVVFLLTAPAAFFTLWNILPVTAWSAGIASVVMGARQALVAAIMAWVLADLRRPVESKDVKTYVTVNTSRIVGRELDGTRLVGEGEDSKDI